MPGPIDREDASRRRLLEAIFSEKGPSADQQMASQMPGFWKPDAQGASVASKPQRQKRDPSNYVADLKRQMEQSQALNADPFDSQLQDMIRQRTVMAPRGTTAMPPDHVTRLGAFGPYAKQLMALAGPDEQAMGFDGSDISPEEAKLIAEATRRGKFKMPEE
jgi:hypothetical protein